MDQLQTRITLTFFPQSAVFLQSGKASRNHLRSGHDLEGGYLMTLGNLHLDIRTMIMRNTPSSHV